MYLVIDIPLRALLKGSSCQKIFFLTPSRIRIQKLIISRHFCCDNPKCTSRKPPLKVSSSSEEYYAVIRVDTHGRRDIVKGHMTRQAALELEAHYESMTHHQGYYVVPQTRIKDELRR